MNKFENKITTNVVKLQNEKAHLFILVATIVMFILSAAAPNAGIGIAK